MTSLITLILATIFFIPSYDPALPPEPAVSFKQREAPKKKELLPLQEIKAEKHSKKLVSPVKAVPVKSTDSSEASQQLNMNGINLLQLEETALLKLGVVVCRNAVSVPVSNGKDPLHLVFTQEGSILSLSAKDAMELGFSKEQSAELFALRKSGKEFPRPRFITDDLGQYWRAHISEQKEELSEKQRQQQMQNRLSVMIPVLVRTGDVYTKEDSLEMRWRPDLILWYEPTEDFLQLLPSLTAVEIKQEKELLLQAVLKEDPKDSTRIAESNEPFSCKYFESCKSDRSLVSAFVVYPNPTRDKISVSLELKEPRNLSFYISDISGRTLVSLQKPRLQLEEKEQYEFDLSALPAGIYLLTVLSDRNERYTARIVKE